jgi:hypothetical protein
MFGGAVEAAPEKAPSFKHIPPRVQDLPAPGSPMKLSFQLINTREITQLVTALVTVDGRLMNVLGSDGYLNEYDNPTFEIATNSPVSDIAYQFVVRGQDGSIATSQRYAVRRSCLPTIDLTSVAIPETVQGRERLSAIIDKTKGLERDLGMLDQTLRAATTLKGMLDDE